MPTLANRDDSRIAGMGCMSDRAKVCTGIPAPPLPPNCRQNFIVLQPEPGIGGGKGESRVRRNTLPETAAMRAPDTTPDIGAVAEPNHQRAQGLTAGAIVRCPLPHLGLGDRLLLRAL